MRLLLIFLLTTFTAFSQEAEQGATLPDEGEGYQHVERFIRIMEEVRANHPDTDLLSYERLVNHALEGMLNSLDPFSAFYHPETVAAFDPDAPEEEPQFTLPSLGITLARRDDQNYFSRIRENSPAARAGFVRGDLLRAKDKRDLTKSDLAETMDALSGPAGQTITLTVYRESSRRELSKEITHAVVKQAALPDAYLLENTGDRRIGYTRLTEFTALAPRELEAALDDLEDQKMESLILDLRGNPGGLLDASVEILGLFLPPNTEVVTTQGRSPLAKQPALVTPKRQRVKREYPIAVLIDRNSASASELVAGALRDLSRATLVGEQSFGKGSVQNINGRDGGTTVRLTFATYHTPSGKTPHRVGVTPDHLVEISEEDLANFERFQARRTASEEANEKLAQWRDPVLTAAVRILLEKPSSN